jgi:cytochrome c peroxidase
VDTTLDDIGRMKISGKKSDCQKFKVPTLRNVEVSYPYMHDGRFRSLAMVLFHYSDGIHQSATLSPQLRKGIKLSENEKRDLTAFLKTLTDETFLNNPAFHPSISTQNTP